MQPPAEAPAAAPLQLKVVIAGGFGAGKTTLVAAVSEITPLTTEELLTEAGSTTDPLTGVAAKTTTTVAMDFGRITFREPPPMEIYLFGTPGQERFIFTWPDLTHGAAGAVILADTRRLADSFTAIDYFERRTIPFIVALNRFDGTPHDYTVDEVRRALALPPDTPVVTCDARQADSAASVLITLISYALTRARSGPSPAQGACT
jgi:signal recognition particle receptor subunit beta